MLQRILILTDDWSKSSKGMPSFAIDHIDSYSQKINTAALLKSKKVMKHFHRGEQLLDQNFIDITSIYSKQSDTLFCLKGLCTSIKKNKTGGL